MKLTVQRLLTANGATLGMMTGLSVPLYILENPWKNNQASVSRIPAGTYQCKPHGWEPGSKVSKPKTWEIMGVQNRSAVLIHIGNYLKNTKGCLLAGMGLQITQLQSMVSDSGTAIELMRREIGEQGFTISIADPVIAG